MADLICDQPLSPVSLVARTRTWYAVSLVRESIVVVVAVAATVFGVQASFHFGLDEQSFRVAVQSRYSTT